MTLKPLDRRRRASDEEIIPFPSEETTPPVTKIYFVSTNKCIDSGHKSINFFSFNHYDLRKLFLPVLFHHIPLLNYAVTEGIKEFGQLADLPLQHLPFVRVADPHTP